MKLTTCDLVGIDEISLTMLVKSNIAKISPLGRFLERLGKKEINEL